MWSNGLNLLALTGIAVVALRLVPAGAPPIHQGDHTVLDGEWIYLEDRTEGRALEQLGPPMSSKFSFRTEPGVVILATGHGSGQRDVRVALDGTPTEATDQGRLLRYTGSWKDGTFSYQTAFFKLDTKAPDGVIKKEFRPTPDGLVVSVSVRENSPSTAIYRHPQDIPMPTPAKATITDLAWMSGAWTGTRGTDGVISFEERWSPPQGGSMLATARTVNRGKLSAFEYLRIVEREGGLVYVAQPGGAAPTEFILTEFDAKRAVFENPRHDYPKKITYELSGESGLTATIGFLKGGTPRRFEFKREGK